MECQYVKNGSERGEVKCRAIKVESHHAILEFHVYPISLKRKVMFDLDISITRRRKEKQKTWEIIQMDSKGQLSTLALTGSSVEAEIGVGDGLGDGFGSASSLSLALFFSFPLLSFTFLTDFSFGTDTREVEFPEREGDGEDDATFSTRASTVMPLRSSV